jgi:hypothetical protein
MLDDDAPFDWGTLESDVRDGVFAPPIKKHESPYAKSQKFPCQACFGTGIWRGRGKCFACGGKGFFLTSEAARQKAKQSRQVSKERKLSEARAAFDEQHPSLAAFLSQAAQWSEFARSLSSAIDQYGALTDKQTDAALAMRAKCEARKTEKFSDAKQIDLSPIRKMFETAVSNGYKKPVYRAAGLVITRAPDHGRNPGALYVTSEADEYLGKLLGYTYQGKPAPGLEAIAADPRGEAIRYGQRTGTCSCCGRTLTNGASIEAGIGPICASKWGL